MPRGRGFKGEPVRTPVITRLEGIKAELMQLSAACDEVMNEVKAISREVGGNADKSPRYYQAAEVKDRVEDLLAIRSGHFEYVLQGDTEVAE